MHSLVWRWLGPRALSAAASLTLLACSGVSVPQTWPSPRELCRTTVQPNVSFGPEQVVGDGTPASCTATALEDAVRRGGNIRFSCGSEPLFIALGRELTVDRDTRIDGGQLIALTTGLRSRVIHLMGQGGAAVTLALAGLTFVGAAGDGVDGAMPAGSSGGAVLQEGGRLFIDDCVFLGNRSAPKDASVSGGAIFNRGGELVIRESNFISQLSTNGGAIGVRDGSLRMENTWLVSNVVQGVGGVPGDGGVGGGIDMRGSGRLVLCESTLWDNYSQSFGGALYRQGTGDDLTAIYGVSFQGNYILPEHTVQSLGGALFLQGTHAVIEATTFYGNAADAGGAAYFGPSTQTLLLNSTFSQNAAERGGGGAVLFEARVRPLPSAEIASCTFAVNQVTSDTGAGGAIAGGGPLIRLRNNLFVANRSRTELNGQTCSHPMESVGPNLQNDAEWSDGSSDATRAPCARGITVGDTQLMQIDFFGGPTKTHYLTADNLAVGLGRDCPATDQRGQTRPMQGCTVGAFEVEH